MRAGGGGSSGGVGRKQERRQVVRSCSSWLNVCKLLLLLLLLTSQVQWRGVSSLRVAAVDVVGAAQLLHPRQAAFLSSVQQGRIAAQQVLDVGVAVFHQVQRRVAVPVLLGRVGTVLRGVIEGIQREDASRPNLHDDENRCCK